MVSVWNAVFFTVNGCIGIIANLFVIAVLRGSKQMMMQESTKFIVNQSTLDTITSFILVFAYSNIAVGYGVPVSYQDDNGLHEFLCKFWNSNFFQWSFIFASTINLVITTLDRYIKICHSMWYKAHIGNKTIVTMLVLPWLIGPIYQGAFFVFINDVRGNTCKHHLWPSSGVGIGVGALSFTVQFLIPILVMIFCYTRIFIMIKKRWKKMEIYSAPNTSTTNLQTSQSQSSIANSTVTNGVSTTNISEVSSTDGQVSVISGNSQQDASTNGVSEKPNPNKNPTSVTNEAQKARNRKSEKKIIKTLLIVSLAFFFCWGCNQVMFFLVNIHVLDFGNIYRTPFYYFQLILAYCNCWVNPIIYITQFRSFRLAICKCVWK